MHSQPHSPFLLETFSTKRGLTHLFVSTRVLQSERTLLFDAMKGELLEKIRRLEEDRQNIDLTSGTCQSQSCYVHIKYAKVIKCATFYANTLTVK